jgi:hypothetical protein
MAAASLPALWNVSVSLRMDRLRTFLHPIICGHGKTAVAVCDEDDWFIHSPPVFRIHWQTHRHPRSLAHATPYVDITAVQSHQAFDDGKAKAGTVVAPVVRRARLKKRFANVRQIGLANADAGVLDREGEFSALAQRTHRDLAATRRELNGIGNEVDQNLVEGAAVGGHFGKILGETDIEPNTGFLRLQRKQVGTPRPLAVPSPWRG